VKNYNIQKRIHVIDKKGTLVSIRCQTQSKHMRFKLNAITGDELLQRMESNFNMIAGWICTLCAKELEKFLS